MAEINPPLYLDQDDAYGAAELGLPFRDIMGEGVVGADDLEVTAGTGLKSSVAAGAAWVKGDDDADAQPTYRVRNDAPVLLQHDAADATNPRIDLVIAQVLDSTFAGVSKLWRLALVKGTPAASPVAPALPADAIALAQVTIPAGSGTLGTITDKRTSALVGGGAAAVAVDPATLPGYELAYGQVTADVVSSATSEASPTTIVTASAFSVDGTTRVRIEFRCPITYASGGSEHIALWDNGAELCIIGAPAYVGSTYENECYASVILTPAAGSHTYSVRHWSNSGATTFKAGTGAGGAGTFSSTYLRVTRA